jgi:3-methyl-2-oxobutanoate hydroxymethyltransferase
MLLNRKAKKQPIVVVTAYDWTQARLADAAGVDAVLVGDSLGMVMLGHDTTLPVTLDDMLRHTRAVARGLADAPDTCPGSAPTDAQRARGALRPLLIADLPFGAYGVSVEDGVRNAVRLIAEGGAQAVKLEGGAAMAPTVRRLVDLGVPVMGHLGMTPQSVHRFGGFKLQGRGEAAADALLADAAALVEAGVFGFVLEVIPAVLARRVTESIPVPTIGIGAGAGCDGQVQVFHDLLGLIEGAPVLRHTRRYAETGRLIREALASYAADVRDGRFPSGDNAF